MVDKAQAELSEALERFKAVQQVRIPILTVFLLLAIGLKLGLNISIPNMIFVVLATLLVSTFVISYLVRRQKLAARVDKINFGYLFFELLMITIIIHYVGTVAWIAPIFYAFIIMHASATFSSRRGLVIALGACVCYISLTLLDYFGAIPHHELFSLTPGLHQNPTFVATTLIVVAGFLLFLGYQSSIYGRLLKLQSEEKWQSERMRAKAVDLLARSEQRYRAIFEHAGDAVMVYDNNGVVQLWNKRAEEMFGYKAEEVVGQKWHLLVPEELQGEVGWLSDELKKKGFVKNYVTERVRKDGTRLTVELTRATIKDAKGKPAGVSAIVRDITEKRQMEQDRATVAMELARSEGRYKAIFEHAGDAVVVYDNNDIVQLWNKRAEEIFGYKAEEVIGKRWYGGVPKELRQESKQLSHQVMEKGVVQEYETERMRKDGTRVPVEVTRAALRDKQGNILGVSAIARDLTDRKRLEQEKEQAQQQLLTSERLAAIGELAATVGHELRNPLGVLSNAAYFLKMKLEDADEKVKRHLDIMEQEVANCNNIINNLLDFARPRQPTLQATDINPIVERALTRSRLSGKVKVVTSLGEGLPRIMADADQLQEVFLNLISNAVEAMPDGGELSIHTTQSDNLAKVEFKDTGTGIAPENMDKIFQPLFSTKAKGTGLGMTIVKSIVERHQGKVEVSSQPENGTIISVILPIGGE